METRKQTSKRKVSETDVQALVNCNKMLKDHLDFLRAKLSKTEAILEMYIKAVEQEEERSIKHVKPIFSLN
jgi:hypothetical protein